MEVQPYWEEVEKVGTAVDFVIVAVRVIEQSALAGHVAVFLGDGPEIVIVILPEPERIGCGRLILVRRSDLPVTIPVRHKSGREDVQGYRAISHRCRGRVEHVITAATRGGGIGMR